MPASATTSASDSISAATVADVRRGAWIRLSAASAPSTGRSHFRGGAAARAERQRQQRAEQQRDERS